ncbi:MAG: NUDIX domain-containing protein [Patescibacteria group bacterium]
MPHIHDLIDFCVNAVIVCDDKVLLVDHKKLHTWMPVGGHIELDEDPDQALLREVREECGLEIEVVADKAQVEGSDVKFLYRPQFVDIHQVNEAHRHVGFVYFCKSKTQAVTLAADEHNAIRWFTLAELADPQFAILPSIRHYAEQALLKFRL